MKRATRASSRSLAFAVEYFFARGVFRARLWAGSLARHCVTALFEKRAAECFGQRLPGANRMEDRQAMAGSPDAVSLRAKRARDSVSPSCSWLSGFLKNHERKPKCSTFTALSWIGAGASS